MKILMIAPQPFFEPRGTPFSVLGRIKALSHLGHEVDLLTYHVGQDVMIPGLSIHRAPSIRFITEVPIGPSWIKCFLDIFLFFKAFRLLLQRRYDLVHSHEEAGVFGVLLAKLFRIRHLYDMHSSMPEQVKNYRYARMRPLIRLFEWLERWVIHSSNAIITICPALEEHVRQINLRVPMVMIENVPQEEEPSNLPEESVRKFKADYSLDHKKIVLYTGTFESYQGLDLLLSSAERIVRQRKDVAFLLVGGRFDQVQHHQNRARELGLSSHFHFTGIRPPEEMPIFMKLADVLVSPRVSGINTPLKIYGYLRSGKPIVATNLYAHTQILNPDVAVLVGSNPDDFAQGVLSVLEDPPLAERLGRQARQFFENRYSFQTFVQQMDQALQMAMRS